MSFSANRARQLRKATRDLGASAFYVRNTANIEWLSGFENVFDDEQAHAMFVVARDDGLILLHTDSRYVSACQREAEGSPVQVDAEVVRMSAWVQAKASEVMEAGKAGETGETGRMPCENGALSEDAASSPDSARIAIEDSIFLHEYRALEEAFGPSACARLVETNDVVIGLRAVKDEDEIDRLKAAQAVTDAAFAHIVGFIKPGMTEREIQLELDGFMLSHGAASLAFPSIVASGENGASPHAIVSDRRLQAGECIVMDFGARRAGYCSDMTRTVFLGRPEGKMLAAWEAMREANETVEAALKPGVTGREAHELAERVLAEGGFEGRMGHGLGHGVGIEIHELPVLSTRNDKPLCPGNVVTVEPGIYIPGEFGMRLEDFGVVTDGGFDVFTQSTHELVVL